MSTTNPTSPTRAANDQITPADLYRFVQVTREETMAMANCMQLILSQNQARETRSERKQVAEDKIKNGQRDKIWAYSEDHLTEGTTLEAFMTRLRGLHSECIATESELCLSKFLAELKRHNPHVATFCTINAKQTYQFEEVETIIRVKSDLSISQLEKILDKWTLQAALSKLAEGAGHKFEFLYVQLNNLYTIIRRQPVTPDAYWAKIATLLNPSDHLQVNHARAMFQVGNRMADFIEYLEVNFSQATITANPRPAQTPKPSNAPELYPMDIGLVADKVFKIHQLTPAQHAEIHKSEQIYLNLLAKGDTVAALKMQTDKKIFCWGCWKLTDHMAKDCKEKRPKGQAQH